jgi:hypothetical protein
MALNLVYGSGLDRLHADEDRTSHALDAWQSFQTGNPRIATKPLQTTDAEKDKSKNKGNQHA